MTSDLESAEQRGGFNSIPGGRAGHNREVEKNNCKDLFKSPFLQQIKHLSLSFHAVQLMPFRFKKKLFFKNNQKSIDHIFM